eukprot:502986_1
MKACLAYGSVISSVTLSLSLKATAWCYFVRPSPYTSLRWRHICGFPTPGTASGGKFELSKQSNPEDEEVQQDNRAAASALGELNGKQRRYLRSIANKRAAAKDGSLVSLRMGSSDNFDAFARELSVQFKKHELLKVKMPNEPKKEECKRLGGVLATKIGGSLVQTVGRTVLLYKENPDSSEKIKF